jgi:hypothetical protein
MEPHATRCAALRADLGLSIVRSITAAHSGTVRARPRPAGGLIMEIDLPPAPSLPASTDLIADRGDTTIRCETHTEHCDLRVRPPGRCKMLADPESAMWREDKIVLHYVLSRLVLASVQVPDDQQAP